MRWSSEVKWCHILLLSCKQLAVTVTDFRKFYYPLVDECCHLLNVNVKFTKEYIQANKACVFIAEMLLLLFFSFNTEAAISFTALLFSTLTAAFSDYGLIFSSNVTTGTLRDFLPTQAPCLKDMRGQKMLWTSWEPCWIGKLLFSCSVPSLSTTLPTQICKYIFTYMLHQWRWLWIKSQHIRDKTAC